MKLNEIYEGDCLIELPKIADNFFDAIVTDPPYGLSFMNKKWDYDVPSVEIWRECLKVLKPGGFLFAFAGTRTQHRMACNIEDAGFEIRDMIAYLYGSGFPKSLNIGKVINKFLKTGNASWNGTGDSSNGALGYSKLGYEQGYRPDDYSNKHQNKDQITEELAKEWEGWGTALKPALEPITVARKPLSEKSVAENVLKWGTGGINIDEGRVKYTGYTDPRTFGGKWKTKGMAKNVYNGGYAGVDNSVSSKGRFPANVLHDGSEEVLNLFPNTKSGKLELHHKQGDEHGDKYNYGIYGDRKAMPFESYGDEGSAARFFYCAKASKTERNIGLKNNHPTVKPIALMEYLIKLVSKEGDIILDPFAGSGTTGLACQNLKRNFILIEKCPNYCEIAKHRLAVFAKKEAKFNSFFEEF